MRAPKCQKCGILPVAEQFGGVPYAWCSNNCRLRDPSITPCFECQWRGHGACFVRRDRPVMIPDDTKPGAVPQNNPHHHHGATALPRTYPPSHVTSHRASSQAISDWSTSTPASWTPAGKYFEEQSFASLLGSTTFSTPGSTASLYAVAEGGSVFSEVRKGDQYSQHEYSSSFNLDGGVGRIISQLTRDSSAADVRQLCTELFRYLSPNDIYHPTAMPGVVDTYFCRLLHYYLHKGVIGSYVSAFPAVLSVIGMLGLYPESREAIEPVLPELVKCFEQIFEDKKDDREFCLNLALAIRCLTMHVKVIERLLVDFMVGKGGIADPNGVFVEMLRNDRYTYDAALLLAVTASISSAVQSRNPSDKFPTAGVLWESLVGVLRVQVLVKSHSGVGMHVCRAIIRLLGELYAIDQHPMSTTIRDLDSGARVVVDVPSLIFTFLLQIDSRHPECRGGAEAAVATLCVMARNKENQTRIAQLHEQHGNRTLITELIRMASEDEYTFAQASELLELLGLSFDVEKPLPSHAGQASPPGIKLLDYARWQQPTNLEAALKLLARQIPDVLGVLQSQRRNIHELVVRRQINPHYFDFIGVIYLYTLRWENCDFRKMLNQALRDGQHNPEAVRPWMGVIKLLDEAIRVIPTVYPKYAVQPGEVVWREEGSNTQTYQRGDTFTECAFPSYTLKPPASANRIASGIVLHDGCKIAAFSRFPSRNQVLQCPLAEFSVSARSKSWEGTSWEYLEVAQLPRQPSEGQMPERLESANSTQVTGDAEKQKDFYVECRILRADISCIEAIDARLKAGMPVRGCLEVTQSA